MKTNVVYGRNRYFYVLIWNIARSSTGLPYQRMKEPIKLS